MFVARAMPRIVSTSRASRSLATSSGTVSSGGMRVAGVPSRGENLNVNPSANPTSRTTLERLLEILVRLARKADDHVGRERRARESPARSFATHSR